MSAPLEPRDPALEALGGALARALDREPSPGEVARSRERLRTATLAPPSAPRRWALALAACALLALLGWGLRPARAPLRARVDGLTLEAGQWCQADAHPRTVTFSEGSTITLAPGAGVRWSSASARGAAVLLERGVLELQVRHRPDTRWSVAAGPYTVDVTGTAFRVAWAPENSTLTLSLHEGRVLLRGPGCGEGLRLHDRQELRARTADASIHLGPGPQTPRPRVETAAPSPVPVSVPTAEPSEPAPRPSRQRPPARTAAGTPQVLPAQRPVTPPTWRELGLAGRWREAMDCLDDAAFRAAVEASDPADLWLLADAARFAAQPQRAREALLALRARGPLEARPRAAYLLGVLCLERLGAPAVAARWFGVYLAEAPDGPLAEEALGRQLQALQAARDLPGAREAAGRYLSRWPRGSFGDFARAVGDAAIP